MKCPKWQKKENFLLLWSLHFEACWASHPASSRDNVCGTVIGMGFFLLSTHCSAGVVPVGHLLTMSERSLKVIFVHTIWRSFWSKGLPCSHHLWCLWSSSASTGWWAFPHSTLLLCIFHILQAVWRWLWDNHHKVDKKFWQNYFFHFHLHVKCMLYASSEAELAVLMDRLAEACLAHPNFCWMSVICISERSSGLLSFSRHLYIA